MKSFREMIKESDIEIGEWTKEDLIILIQEEDFSPEDISEITELVLDIVEFGEFENMSDEEAEAYEWEDEDVIDEKMSNKAKRDAKKKRKKPAFKKAKKLKKKCTDKHAKVIAKTKDSGTPKVCGSDGKLKKGMGRSDKRKLMKTRKKNKNKIIK